MSIGEFSVSNEVLISFVGVIGTLLASLLAIKFKDSIEHKKRAKELIINAIAAARNLSFAESKISGLIERFLSDEVPFSMANNNQRFGFVYEIQNYRTQLATSLLYIRVSVASKGINSIVEELDNLNVSVPPLPLDEEFKNRGVLSRERLEHLSDELNPHSARLTEEADKLISKAEKIFSANLR